MCFGLIITMFFTSETLFFFTSTNYFTLIPELIDCIGFIMASYRGLLLQQQGFIELIKLTVKKARLVTITIEHCKIRTILSV